jgi:two-component system response regulator PilR (NtrC family)
LLVNHFVKKYAPAARKTFAQVNRQSLEALSSYDWPGNVRQLENTIERAVALESGDDLMVELPAERPKAKAAAAGAGANVTALVGSALPQGLGIDQYLADIEIHLLKSALAQSNGVQTRAAELLKISYRSFRHLMKKYDLSS